MSIAVSEKGSAGENIRWLIFDAVGTLIQPTPSVAIAYHTIAARHGSNRSISEVGDQFRQAFRQSETDLFPGGPAAGSPWLTSDEIEIATGAGLSSKSFRMSTIWKFALRNCGIILPAHRRGPVLPT